MNRAVRDGRLRWGVLATGAIADEIVPGLLRSDRNSLLAVGSRSLGRSRAFAERFGIDRAYGSYDDLLADPEVDSIYCCLPNSLHAEWTTKALEAGKHVLSEKPLTPSADEAEALFDVAARCGRHLEEAFMYRHHPKTRALGELVRSGRLGPVHTVRSSFNWYCEDPSRDVRYRPDLNGGSLLDVGSYCVSMSNFLLDDEPVETRGAAVIADSGVEERFYGTMLYSSGAAALFDCSMRSPLSVGVTVVGELGEAAVAMPWYAHLDPQTMTVRFRDGQEEIRRCEGENAYFLQTEDFAAVVLDDAEPVVTREETVRTLRTIAALRDSQVVV